jgi:hypothetical protein
MVFTWEDDIMSPESMLQWGVLVVTGSLLTRLMVKWFYFKRLSFNLKGY